MAKRESSPRSVGMLAEPILISMWCKLSRKLAAERLTQRMPRCIPRAIIPTRVWQRSQDQPMANEPAANNAANASNARLGSCTTLIPAITKAKIAKTMDQLAAALLPLEPPRPSADFNWRVRLAAMGVWSYAICNNNISRRTSVGALRNCLRKFPTCSGARSLTPNN